MKNIVVKFGKFVKEIMAIYCSAIYMTSYNIERLQNKWKNKKTSRNQTGNDAKSEEAVKIEKLNRIPCHTSETTDLAGTATRA